MGSGAEHNPSNDVLGGNWRIAFLAGVAAREEAIAFDVFKNQAMGAQAARRFGNHNVAHSEAPGGHAFDAQRFAVPDERQHAPAARLKPDLMAARQKSPAQLLEQSRIAPMISRGRQGFSPPHSGRERIGSDSTGAHPPFLRARLAPDPRTAVDKRE